MKQKLDQVYINIKSRDKTYWPETSEVLGGDERRVSQEADQWRHEVQEGGPVLLHQLHKRLGLELWQHDVLDTLVQPAGHGHIQAEYVEEGEDANSCVLNLAVIL